MAFLYVHDTAAGIADWFARFENFLALVGWSVEQGTGTTNLIIRSLGEDNSYTMLWAHVWQVPATTNVRTEVQDDLAGTHVTGETVWNPLLCGAGAFDYWMTGDKEGIHITFNFGATWRHIYIGCTYAFALAIDDETYKMISTETRIMSASILRNHDDVWDVDIACYWNNWSDDIRICPMDGSFTVMGIYANHQGACAGQIPNMTGRINDPAIPALTEFTTRGEGTRETNWIVLQDLNNWKFAVRTGGAVPIGFSDGGGFRHERGIADSPAAFIETTLPAFMTAVGWQDLGDPGVDTEGRLFHSAGESGADDIFLLVTHLAGANEYFRMYVQDDALGTNRTTVVYVWTSIGAFPGFYWMSADRDCLVFTPPRHGLFYDPIWGGKVTPASPNIIGTPYQVGAVSEPYNRRYMLRDHDGNWNQIVTVVDAEAELTDSSPNLFDDETYLLWPLFMTETIVGGRDAIGMLKYYFSLDGCMTTGDIIPVAAREYTVFYGPGPGATAWWAMRSK